MSEYVVERFGEWLESKGFVSLEDAAKFQDEAKGRDRFKIVDLAVEYVQSKGGTYRGMSTRYSSIRSYFLHKRVELPRVSTNFTATADATVGHLDREVFRVWLRESGLRDNAVYLTLFMGFMDQKRFFEMFNPHGYELGQHIKEKGVDQQFRVEFLRGRKKNPRPYNSWIGHDALEAWRIYFERERGYPNKGEPAAVDRDGKPLSKFGFFLSHLRRLRRLKYVKENGNAASRYGYNLHELRDLARSEVEKAKGEGFNTLSAEYWMGHIVDPLFYNKVWKLDPEYNVAQFQIVEKHLNVLSGSTGADPGTQTRIKDLEKRLGELEKVYTKRLEVTAE